MDDQYVRDMGPRHSFGYINPVLISDFIHYQFYSVFPADTLLTAYHMGLNRFTAEGVDDALQAFWPAIDFLSARQVERISLGGIPLSAFAGRARILDLVEQASQRARIPVTTDFEESIDALRSFGVRRVVAAAKWDAALMEAVAAYLRHAGFDVVGTYGEAHTAQQVVALRAQESSNIAIELGRAAFRAYPNAEALLLAGGAWLVLPTLPILEAEFGKPVVSNPASTYWAALKQANLSCKRQGFGRLLDGTRSH